MPNKPLTPYLYSLNDLQKKEIAALLKLTEKQTPASFEALKRLANEWLRYSHDVIEAALAHVDKNSIRATYNRAEYIEQRRVMMQWWSTRVEVAATGSLSISGKQGLKAVS